MRKFYFLFSSFAFLLSSCDRVDQQYDKAYFDFDSLINVQVLELGKAKANFSKKSTIGSKNDNSSFVPDSLSLANELDIFRQLDLINKPLYRKSYNVKVGEKDTKSNLLIRSYTAKTPSPVPYVKLYYQSSPLDIRKIESSYHEKNALYNTSRKLTLLFDDSSGFGLLRGYQITGTQKMILSDTVYFSVEVSVSPGSN